jgi:hypothetical protein
MQNLSHCTCRYHGRLGIARNRVNYIPTEGIHDSGRGMGSTFQSDPSGKHNILRTLRVHDAHKALISMPG